MLHRSLRVGMVVVLLTLAFLASGGTEEVYAQGGRLVIEEIVHQANISSVIELIQEALTHNQGLSLEDHEIVYSAIGETNVAVDRLYNTGVTGDVFRTAEALLLLQLDLLREVEIATLSGDIDDLRVVAPMLVELAQAKLAFNRQIGHGLTPLAAERDVSVVDIARDDEATRAAIAEVVAAIVEGRPIGLEVSDQVYRALGETARGLDLIDETGETGDVFIAAERVLEQRFHFLVDLERAVISGDLDDLRAVAHDWVELSKAQLTFERQLASRETRRSGQSFLERRQSSFPSGAVQFEDATAHASSDSHSDAPAQLYVVQSGDSLHSIAEKFGITTEQLAQANNIRGTAALRLNMRLAIPASNQ